MCFYQNVPINAFNVFLYPLDQSGELPECLHRNIKFLYTASKQDQKYLPNLPLLSICIQSL